jgi:hypothetical protein
MLLVTVAGLGFVSGLQMTNDEIQMTKERRSRNDETEAMIKFDIRH